MLKKTNKHIEIRFLEVLVFLIFFERTMDAKLALWKLGLRIIHFKKQKSTN